MHAPPPPPGPPPGVPPGIVVRTTTPNPPPPPHPPGSAPPPPPPKPPAHILSSTATSPAAATPTAKKRANAAATTTTSGTKSTPTGTQQSAAKKLKSATSPPGNVAAAAGGAYSSGIKTKPAIKPIETEETLFQRSLRNLGQSNLGDLLHLVEGLVEHRKRGESSATTRDFLQKYMQDQTTWSGDYCASLLVPIYATQNSNTDTLDDVSMLNLSSRNTSSRDLIERFLKPNWWFPPGSTTATSTAASAAQTSPPPPPPPPVTSTETCAFALWATNQFASTVASAGSMDTSEALLAKWAMLPQGTKMHFENLATQENKMREVYMKKH